MSSKTTFFPPIFFTFTDREGQQSIGSAPERLTFFPPLGIEVIFKYLAGEERLVQILAFQRWLSCRGWAVFV